MQRPDRPIAIIGAGIAGLTAAEFLRRRGVPHVLFEGGPKVAGLAESFHDPGGFSYDFGAHFITNRLAAAVGIGAQCRTVEHYGEAVFLNGRTYGYPLGLLRNPRFLAGGLMARLRRSKRARSGSAAEWFQSQYGTALAESVVLPLLEAWSGAPATELAASVGNKLQNSILRTLVLKSASSLLGRAVACGYSHEMPERPSVWHVYPEGGVSLLCKRLADGLGDTLRLNSPVQSIGVEAGRVDVVRVNGVEIPVSGVVSTAPLPVLAKLVTGSDCLEPLKRFRYRPMVFVNLRLEGRHLLADTMVWTPGKGFPFFRLTEAPRSMPWLAPAGKTIITADLGCEVGDPVWQMTDESLGELCLTHLESIIPDIRRRYLGCRALRTPIAYPVYLKSTEEERLRLEQGTGIKGLLSIGRNGEFSHLLMEDVYWRTLKKMRQFLTEVDVAAEPNPALGIFPERTASPPRRSADDPHHEARPRLSEN